MDINYFSYLGKEIIDVVVEVYYLYITISFISLYMH